MDALVETASAVAESPLENALAAVDDAPGKRSRFRSQHRRAAARHAVVEGGVRHSGDRLRATARLVRTDDGYQLPGATTAS